VESKFASDRRTSKEKAFMLDTVLIAIFSSSFGVIVYGYIGYPCLVWILSRFARCAQAPANSDAECPRLSLLIAAHNEESVIGKRIENALALDYPNDKLEVVVASDGSTDGTTAIVSSYATRGVRLADFAGRRGKSSVLNETIPTLTGEIVLLSDANTFYDSSAARCLARWFADSQVGAVCGRLVLFDPASGTNVDSLYWKYETFLKRCEGRLGGLLGANGAVYAIRKSMYRPIPNDTLVDDFVIPIYAKIHSRCRIVYDCSAIAHEETPHSVRAEFRRRCRIGSGAYQSLAILWRILSPRHGWTTFTFISHKVVRWLCPFLMLALLATNLLLLHLPVFQWLLVSQLAFYTLAALAPYLPLRFTALKPLRLATMFAGMNLALLVGFVRLLRDKQSGTWSRTPRCAEANGN
jgi:cellulose synthase/poly-beta-1,6-N-acetylglucosamine synthase-like glycosyltransferase